MAEIKNNEDEKDYSYPVHRSIMKRQLIFGVPTVPLIIVVITTFIILIDFKVIAIIPFSVLIILLIREITKKDEYLLEIFLQSLLQPDELE